jgi:mono/diheme cytochrome c family protein
MNPGGILFAMGGVLALAGVGCMDRGEAVGLVVDGSAARGRLEIARLQCGACHAIPGVRAARGVVGPSLEGFARRPHLAGKWPNQPRYLVAWLRDPPAMSPHTAMPAVVGDEQAAREIAAYLYTLD